MTADPAEAPSSRILLVDDDKAILRMLCLTLMSEGFEVATAANGPAALAQASSSDFDLIILDLQMPDMDGRALYRELRRRGIRTPVLVASAYGALAACEDLHADGALAKPFDFDVLLKTISHSLNQNN